MHLSQVLQSVVAAEATVCPARVITEEKREALRATKCLPPSLATPQELATFYEASVQNAAESHSQAYTEVVRSSTSSESQMCLFDIPLYDSCAIISSVASRFSPSDQFAANVSFEGLGLVFAPSLQELVDSGSVDLQTLTSDQVLIRKVFFSFGLRQTWELFSWGFCLHVTYRVLGRPTLPEMGVLRLPYFVFLKSACLSYITDIG